MFAIKTYIEIAEEMAQEVADNETVYEDDPELIAECIVEYLLRYSEPPDKIADNVYYYFITRNPKVTEGEALLETLKILSKIGLLDIEYDIYTREYKGYFSKINWKYTKLLKRKQLMSKNG
jgi:hypothetical protein